MGKQSWEELRRDIFQTLAELEKTMKKMEERGCLNKSPVGVVSEIQEKSLERDLVDIVKDYLPVEEVEVQSEEYIEEVMVDLPTQNSCSIETTAARRIARLQSETIEEFWQKDGDFVGQEKNKMKIQEFDGKNGEIASEIMTDLRSPETNPSFLQRVQILDNSVDLNKTADRVKPVTLVPFEKGPGGGVDEVTIFIRNHNRAPPYFWSQTRSARGRIFRWKQNLPSLKSEINGDFWCEWRFQQDVFVTSGKWGPLYFDTGQRNLAKEQIHVQLIYDIITYPFISPLEYFLLATSSQNSCFSSDPKCMDPPPTSPKYYVSKGNQIGIVKRSAATNIVTKKGGESAWKSYFVPILHAIANYVSARAPTPVSVEAGQTHHTHHSFEYHFRRYKSEIFVFSILISIDFKNSEFCGEEHDIMVNNMVIAKSKVKIQKTAINWVFFHLSISHKSDVENYTNKCTLDLCYISIQQWEYFKFTWICFKGGQQYCSCNSCNPHPNGRVSMLDDYSVRGKESVVSVCVLTNTVAKNELEFTQGRRVIEATRQNFSEPVLAQRFKMLNEVDGDTIAINPDPGSTTSTKELVFCFIFQWLIAWKIGLTRKLVFQVVDFLEDCWSGMCFGSSLHSTSSSFYRPS